MPSIPSSVCSRIKLPPRVRARPRAEPYGTGGVNTRGMTSMSRILAMTRDVGSDRGEFACRDRLDLRQTFEQHVRRNVGVSGIQAIGELVVKLRIGQRP